MQLRIRKVPRKHVVAEGIGPAQAAGEKNKIQEDAYKPKTRACVKTTARQMAGIVLYTA